MADYTTVMSDTTALDSSLVLAFEQMFLVAVGQNNVMDQFCQVRSDIGAKSIQLTKYARLALATTPLGEKEDPASEVMSDSAIILTPAEYGNVVTTTALANLQSGGKADMAAAQIVGMNVGSTLDKLAVLAGDASTNSRIVAGKAEGDVLAADVLSRAEINRAYNRLARASVPTINGAYVMVAHDDVITDVRADTSAGSWSDVTKYARPEEQLMGEVGMFGGFRFVRNNNSTFADQSGAGTVDLYNSYAFGANALGKAESLSPQLVLSQTDKLKRFLNVGWKSAVEYKIIDQDAFWLIQTASSVGNNAA
jgi:N4-gp56 family major capsid protein